MTKLYVWTIPTDYRGYSIGYTNTLFLWVLAETLELARKKALDKMHESTYPMKFRQDILKVVQEESPKIHEEGEVGMF